MLATVPEQENQAIEITTGEMLYKPQDCDPVALIVAKRNLLRRVTKSVLIEGKDYGTVPGISEKFLLKPGAEKLLSTYLMSFSLEMDDRSIEDWDTGFFYYRYRATVRDRANNTLAVCEGSCNSKESKYRYRWVNENQATPDQKANAIASRQKGGKYGKYWQYRVENPDIYDQQNTILKMAQKRALVGATLIATQASDVFKQVSPEVEEQHSFSDDQVVEVEYTDRPQGTGNITEPQKKRLFAIAKKAGYSTEALKAMVAQFGYSSRNDIPKGEVYESICQAAENTQLAADWNAYVEQQP